MGKPFPQEQELRDKSARLAELDVLLNMDGRGRPAPEAVLAKSGRPSVLEGLKRPVPPRCPEKKPKHHEQRCDNMNTNKNTALPMRKMAAEQDKFRDWLKGQPPEEILNHAYEYTVREDILMAMEELGLPKAGAAALLASPSPLADVYKEFADRETSYMDVVRDSIEQRAEAALDASGNCRSTGTTPPMPVSRATWIYTGRPARQHCCKEAIEASLSEHYRDNRLDRDAVPQVIEQFGYTRTLYVAGKHRTADGMGWTVQPGQQSVGQDRGHPAQPGRLRRPTATWTSWWTATPVWSICS